MTLRHSLRVCTSIAALLALLPMAPVLAVDKDKAMYAGGTITALEEKAEGRLNTDSEDEFRFNAGDKGAVSIPYASITSLEYGQKAGRRVAVGILVYPIALFSK